MEFSDIAAVAGKGGLFKVVKPTRSGVILESLDEHQKKLVAGPNNRVSILKEISIYTYSEQGSTPLDEVLVKVYEEYGDDIGLTGKSDPEELKSFLKSILPDYDEERVYVSDIKKLVNWYNILVKEIPEILQPQQEESEQEAAPTEAKVEEGKQSESEGANEEKSDETSEKS